MGHSPYRREQQTEATPQDKYELPEEEVKAGLLQRLSAGLMLTGVFVLIKEVFFGSDANAKNTSDIVLEEEYIEPPSQASNDQFSLTPDEEPEQADQDTLEGASGSSQATSSRSTSVDNFLTPEQPVKLGANAKHLLPAANDDEPEGPQVGSDASKLPLEVGSKVEKSDSNSLLGSDDEDSDSDDSSATNNLGPIAIGPVQLIKSSRVNLSITIAAAILLKNVIDPDGDGTALQIRNLKASSGTLVKDGENWIFTPDKDDTSEVIFTYEVTDGIDFLQQTATIDLLPEFIDTDGIDRLFGTATADYFEGLDGADTIFALAGDDIAYGNAGDDQIFGGDGDDTLYGGEGNDSILGGAGNDVIYGGAGNDRLYGEAGDDIIFGGDGDDLIFGGFGNDYIIGGKGNDSIWTGFGKNIFVAGVYDDDNNFVAGEIDGNDKYHGDGNLTLLDHFKIEADTLFDLPNNIVVSSETGTDDIDGIPHIIAGSGNDTLIGDDNDNGFQGGAGDDLLKGGDGDDTLQGGEGEDTIEGGAGADTIDGGTEADTIDGGTGDDTIDGDSGADTIDGGEGDDNIDGGSGNDTIYGGTGNDDIDGSTGSDTIDGGSGGDEINGGTGSDIIDGGDGADIINGGSGADTVVGGEGTDGINGGDGADILTGGADDDFIDGDAGDDRFIATIADGDDNYLGDTGIDTYDLSATQEGVVIDLSAGTADGAETGHDTLSGIENVVGGSGDDVFIANEFVNVFTGGAGNDTFEFNDILDAASTSTVRNTIMDFQVGDKIDLSSLDANWTLPDNQDFELVVDKLEFSNAGEVKFRFESFGDNDERTIVEGNIDEDGEIEFEIELKGHHDLTIDDFIGVN